MLCMQDVFVLLACTKTYSERTRTQPRDVPMRAMQRVSLEEIHKSEPQHPDSQSKMKSNRAKQDYQKTTKLPPLSYFVHVSRGMDILAKAQCLENGNCKKRYSGSQ
mmetsp:Transcript_119653/g.187672  ORF Transcript_119653/g.187672 Transcript_119653/m.187672 type:complete len:106 (-) Transcript_119653:172-489(-)